MKNFELDNFLKVVSSISRSQIRFLGKTFKGTNNHSLDKHLHFLRFYSYNDFK